MTVRGAKELRVKESDRIAMLARGFAGLGIRVDEYDDGFTIHGRTAGGRRGRRGRRSSPGHGVCHRGQPRPGRRPGHGRRRGRGVVSRLLRRARTDRARVRVIDKIYLVGFMTAGKTTVARALATRLGWRAEDVDELIEARERMTVADIFARHGEPYFRAAEREILRLVLPVAARGGRNRWRHLHGSREPARHQSGRHVRVAGRARSKRSSRVCRSTDGVRSRPTARRWNGCSRCGRPAMPALIYGSMAPAPRKPLPSAFSTSSGQAGHREARPVHTATPPLHHLTAPQPHVRFLILSDIHANLDAFETVLTHAAGKWDRVLVLGDLVGYGAEPDAVVNRVRELSPDAVIRGNHDKAACGIDDGSQFNTTARIAAMWTGEQLSPDNLAYLRALPMGPLEIDAQTEICHGAPFDEDHYIFDGSDAVMAFQSAGHAALPLRAHAPAGHLPAHRRALRRRAAGRRTRSPAAAAAGRPVPRERGVGRPASRRRSARRIRRPRRRRARTAPLSRLLRSGRSAAKDHRRRTADESRQQACRWALTTTTTHDSGTKFTKPTKLRKKSPLVFLRGHSDLRDLCAGA